MEQKGNYTCHKVYVTAKGLIPINPIDKGEAKLFCINGNADENEKKYKAWLVDYIDEEHYSKDYNANFLQDVFETWDNTDEFLPIIHISSTVDLLAENKSVARYSQITDSSIWNYFVWFTNEDRHFEAPMLPNVINTIRTNYDRNKYCLMVAREYANLNYRLVKESRLVGDHANHVSPFLFHSEQKMHEKVEQLKNIVINKKYQWKVLLLDDCAVNDRMDTWPEDTILTKNKWNLFDNNKLSIIIDQLEECGFNCQWAVYSNEQPNSPNLEKGKNLLLFCTHTIKEAEEILKKEKFDIILLDYKLKGEYSYKLLKDISSSEELKKNAGIAEKYFFMYISAYSTAVSERLLAESLNRSEKYWYIGEGACPTNTPELFKYHLLHLMKRRLDQLGITDLSNDNVLSTVQNVYKQEEGERTKVVESVRYRAYEAYHKILEYHYNYYLLKKDKGKSMLVDSFLEKQVHLEAMLEHLLQMVHLTAFGTVRQWPEIWEEYKFFSRTYNGKNEDLHQVESDIDLHQVESDIEKYIILLKSE